MISQSAAKGVSESWREKGTDVVFLSLISMAGRELAMLEDVAGIVDALQDVNVDVAARPATTQARGRSASAWRA